MRASLFGLGLGLSLALAIGCSGSTTHGGAGGASSSSTTEPPATEPTRAPTAPSTGAPSHSPAPSPALSGTPGGAACDKPPAGQPMTPQQCSCFGGRVNTSMGGQAQAHCAPTETELGTVRIGIEGGWCCKGT